MAVATSHFGWRRGIRLLLLRGSIFPILPSDVALAKVSSPRFKPSLSGRRRREPEFSRAVFDYVISCECLEHVPHLKRWQGRWRSVLKPGGKFILTTENYFNGMLLAWLHSSLKSEPFDSGGSLQPVEHFFLRVKKILERGGLRVEHMESNHFQWLASSHAAQQALHRGLCRLHLEACVPSVWSALHLPGFARLRLAPGGPWRLG